MSDRELPASIEAERCVLGSILLNPAVYDRIATIIDTNDFFDRQHKLIFGAIVAMEGKGVDLQTLKDRLRADGKLDEVGMSAYISGLVDRVPDVANAEKYVRAVRDDARRRDAIVQCRRLATAAYERQPISDLAADAMITFSDIAAARDSGPVAVRDVARRSNDRLEERIARGSWLTGIPTAIHTLDAYTLGIQRGVESIVGGRPRVGKTAFGLSVTIEALKRGYRVAFVELDMSEAMLGDRLLAATSGVKLFKIRSGQGLDQDEISRIVAASAQLSSYGDALVMDHSTREIAKIAASVRKLARNGGLDLLIVDHIGHVRGGRGEKRYLEIGDVSARLIELASETNAAVLTLAQLNRDAEDRPPTLADLRESGNLEQDARLVILLDRQSLRGDDAPECKLTISVPKNEGETTSEVTAHFNLEIQRITETREAHCRHCVSARLVERGQSGAA